MADNVLRNLERYVKELLQQPAQMEQQARQLEQRARQRTILGWCFLGVTLASAPAFLTMWYWPNMPPCP